MALLYPKHYLGALVCEGHGVCVILVGIDPEDSAAVLSVVEVDESIVGTAVAETHKWLVI